MKKYTIWFIVVLLSLGILFPFCFQDEIFPWECFITLKKQTTSSASYEQLKKISKPIPPSTRKPVISPRLSNAVLAIIDDTENVFRRIKLANRLPNNLSSAERKALYEYLKTGINNRETHHLKNDIINALRNQLTPPVELTQCLLDIFYDETQSITMRSYALQHMRPWYWEENMRDPAVKQAFYDGLEQADNELSGVALLALAYLSEELPNEFDHVFIAEKAAALAQNPDTTALTRVSALDISSRYGNTSTLEVARNILKTEKGNVMLCAAACGAIGRMGDVADLALLDQVQIMQPAIQTAARYAEKSIRIRSKH